MLRYLRIAIAIVVGALFLYVFTGFSGSEESRFIARISHLQIVPALIAGFTVITIAFLILTLLFGRIYCSVLCPLGLLQDLISRISNMVKKLMKRKKERQGYYKAHTILRYSVLVATVIGYFAGGSILLLILDPYSNFGRIATNLFKPIVLLINNIGAKLLQMIGSFYLYAVEVDILSVGSFLFSIALLIILIVMVVKRHRLWCNTICPVGTLLGVISKVSLFKIIIDHSKCTHCKKCVTNCKSHCIDDKNGYVDHSRCVVCFNCLTQCRTNAVGFKFNPKIVRCKNVDEVVVSQESKEVVVSQENTKSRREFIALVATSSVLPIVEKTESKLRLNASRYPMPPGAGSLDEFQKRCTACKLCVSHCPSHLLRPALFENGINGFMQPYMSFNVHKFCEYECKACIDVCPNHALQPITLEQKKLTQVGVVHFDIEHCVVKKKNQYCGACAEHCPTQAVRMIEYENGLTIPKINPEICIGCGACESICPVRPNAIYVVRNDIQITVKPPEIKESEDIKVDDFGF
ncbi:MAG: 4Fe-4S binding protein [Rikenellaceae bacterium]